VVVAHVNQTESMFLGKYFLGKEENRKALQEQANHFFRIGQPAIFFLQKTKVQTEIV